MMKIGLIGAGTISQKHLSAYAKNPHAQVIAIADLNGELAKKRAEEFGVGQYCTDYQQILENPQIDAVSIVTPTFTHSDLTVEALQAGKHVLCEKPPARTVAETERAVQAAKETGKLLMYAFVCRFLPTTTFLKNHIKAGRMGPIYHADVMRVLRYSVFQGWFTDKEKSGGGILIDGAIHQLDQVMYLMDYPKVKDVLGFTTTVNNDLAGKIKGVHTSYVPSDTNHYDRNVESMASGYVTLDNGAVITVKTGNFCYSVTHGVSLELTGKDGGAKLEGNDLTLLSNIEDFMAETKPVIGNEPVAFEEQINHFVDCCQNGSPCICQGEQAVELMKIIEGIYRSAEEGRPVCYIK